MICVTADEERPRRTFGYFAREDREQTQHELGELEATLRAVHFHEAEEDEGLTARRQRRCVFCRGGCD